MRFAGEEYAPVASGGKRISNVTGASVRRDGPAKKISDMSAKVGVIMGSTSDWEVMAAAAETLEAFGIPYEKRVVSDHRTPDLLVEYAKTARGRGIEVIIAGAGGAAHLPGMVASMTPLPVAVDRSDAGRRAGGDGGDQRSEECRIDCRVDLGLVRRGGGRTARCVPDAADGRRVESGVVGWVRR